ncbi:MAG: hypothetical protein JNJ60_08810 [Rhodocyclaceae bacterium]|nr:hypothetical protein [Rhodocyclaceae bacterium]
MPAATTRGLWALFAAWLVYTCAALGWHLATDPWLAGVICGSRNFWQ